MGVHTHGLMSHHRRSAAAVAVLACLLLVVLEAAPALAAPGDLDTTFGGDGTGTITTTLPDGAFANAVAIQADGRIVVVGAAAGTTGTGEFAVVRYEPDGTLDATFGPDGTGTVTTPIAGGGDEARSVAIQANGRILVAGTDDEERFAVVRYRRDGTLDETFGGDGIVRTNLTPRHEGGWDLAIQADGRIVVAGVAGVGRGRFAVVRYRRDGTLDRTFGDGGVVLAIRGGVARAVALQPDGRIVVAGYGPFGLTLVRLRSDGSLDPSFGRDGAVRRAASEVFPLDVAIQPNGRIVAGGDFDIFAFGIARFTRKGRLDASWGGDGVVRTEVPGAPEQAVTGLLIQADGRIVATGYVTPHESIEEGEPSFALARYLRDGTLDTSWGGDGTVTTTFEGGAFARGAAAQADGRIVVVGGAGGGDAPLSFALARYLV